MTYYLASLLTLALFLGYFVTSRALSKALIKLGVSKHAAPVRAIYIGKIFNLGMALVVVLALCFIWGVDYNGLLVLTSSVLAVMGIGLVAQWSLLSNITASIIIFFSYPARIGDEIRVVDGDNSIEGTIIDITLFQVLIKNKQDDIVNYPNNLLMQKPMIKLSKKRPVKRLNLPRRTH